MQYLKLDNITPSSDKTEIIDFESFTFNGGEEHILIKDINVSKKVIIEVRLTSSIKIIQLLLATNALRNLGVENIELFSPYIPYGRQDRICNTGEAFSLKVITDLINSQNYSKVYTLHDHSLVTPALLKNHVPINLFHMICYAFGPSYVREHVLISPDAGALKKTYELAKLFCCEVVSCNKIRNVSNGNIESISINSNDLKGKDCLIIDDICDGGGTFIGIAKELKKKNCGKIKLFVSHGIFSKGTDIFKGLIDEIVTTNSMSDNIDELTIITKIYNVEKLVSAVTIKGDYNE